AESPWRAPTAAFEDQVLTGSLQYFTNSGKEPVLEKALKLVSPQLSGPLHRAACSQSNSRTPFSSQVVPSSPAGQLHGGNGRMQKKAPPEPCVPVSQRQLRPTGASAAPQTGVARGES
ncbi:unnamed protein product, partial [Symbiodinium microadriaticum]